VISDEIPSFIVRNGYPENIIGSLPCRSSNRQMKVDNQSMQSRDQVMQEGNTTQSRAYNIVRGDRLGNIYTFIWRTITSG